jgi:hypothetical protein
MSAEAPELTRSDSPSDTRDCHRLDNALEGQDLRVGENLMMR